MTKNIFSTLLILNILFAGGDPGSFLRLPTSPQSLALGNISTVVESGAHIGMQNPAMLAFLSKRKISTSFASLPLDRSWNAMSISSNVPPTASIAFGWIHAGVHEIDGRNFEGEHTGFFDTSEDVFSLSFANRFHRTFAIGGSAKILQHHMPILEDDGLTINSGFGIDIGFVFAPSTNWKIAGTIRDMMSQTTWKTGELFEHGRQYEENFPDRFAIGSSLNILQNKLFLEWEKIPDVSENLKLGVSINFSSEIIVHMGYDGDVIRLGSSVKWDFIMETISCLDYAFDPGKVGEGVSHWFTWSFSK